ncbi:MAG: type II toxin-antitoxin system Phd/YefM family antitoxin [Anaerolineaceae bacterium]
MDNIWQLQEAKSRFSEMVNRALNNGAQIVTRHGKKTVVVLPYSEFERMTSQKGSLSSFLLASPLAGTEIDIPRDKSLPRRVEIE